MKYTFVLVMLYIGMAIVGCKTHSGSTMVNKIDTSWTMLTIKSEDETVIAINNNSDTTMVKYYDNGGFFTTHHKTKIDSLKTYFTKAEKDSVFYLADDIISNPVRHRVACTDFVGDLEVTIYYGRYKDPGSYKKSIAYSGICNWESLSDKTKLLHKILQKRIKWWSK